MFGLLSKGMREIPIFVSERVTYPLIKFRLRTYSAYKTTFSQPMGLICSSKSKLSEKEVKIAFVRQPELSTTGQQAKLLLAIYSYYAEREREYISLRTNPNK